MTSSTRAASRASASSSTGRPWHALRTPLTTLARLNGSVTPQRFTTDKDISSTVVKRRPHSGHERRRRMASPSLVSRLSTTRLSGWRQNGQRTVDPPLSGSVGGGCSRSEEHTSELQSRLHLVCRLLLEKKKKE